MKKKNHKNEPEKRVEEPQVVKEEQQEEPSLTDKKDEIADEIDQLKSELDQLKDTHLRLMAEYDNFRKRTIKEKADLIKSGGERVLTNFIEIGDDLDLALQNMSKSKEIESVIEGVTLIHNKFKEIMKRQGVEEIPTTGEPFDPEKYEAIAMVPTEDPEQKGRIIDCVKKGYMLNDKVIRHPKVVVGN